MLAVLIKLSRGSSNRVLWHSNIPSTNCSTNNYGGENTVEFETGVAWVSIPFMTIDPQMALNLKYNDHLPLSTTQDKRSIIKHVMEVLRPFQYWTLWMAKWHTVMLHYIIAVYNVIFDHVDGVMQAVVKRNPQWKEALNFTVKYALQTLSKYFVEVNPMIDMVLDSALIIDPFPKLRSCRKWDMVLHFNPDDETSNTTKYQEALLRCVENEYCAKHRCLPIIKPDRVPSNNLFLSTTHSGSGQSSFDPYYLSSNYEEYLTPENVAEMTPGRSDCAALSLTAAMVYLNSPPESPQNRGQVNMNLNDYQSNPMQISSTFLILDITNW